MFPTHGINSSWYRKITYEDNPHVTRSDFRIARWYRRKIVRNYLLAKGLAEYFKTHRLLPDELNEWHACLSTGNPVNQVLVRKLRLAFAEGVLRDDNRTIDEDAFIGTCGQLVFRWIRATYYGDEILYTSPRLQTDSSKKQGIDLFEILGNPDDPASLYYIVWEIKATDSDVTGRTDEIYRMHKKRTGRLLRGLQVELSFEYPEDEHPVLAAFTRQILDHWFTNTACKRIGGVVVFDTTNNPGDVFTTFHSQFKELHSAPCRQVVLIEIPKFRRLRKKLWNYLQAQMS